MARFRDIPQLTSCSGYTVNVGWDYLPFQIARHVLDHNLNMEPDFQRGHVWTPVQKVKYIEYILRGGRSGRDLWFNCPGWQSLSVLGDYVLVDGKQRLDAVLGFLSNEFQVFDGHYFRDYTDRLRGGASPDFVWHVNTLATRTECLQWYIDLNRGGTVHTEEEIAKVRRLMGPQDWVKPTAEEIRSYAGFHRSVLQEAIAEEQEKERERAIFQATAAAAKTKPKPPARRRRRA